MEKVLKNAIEQQFGASIKMLENAIKTCPKSVWEGDSLFWYNAYHALFFLDYYLSLDAATFAPPPPFDFSEFEDRMPDRVYSQAELLVYLAVCDEKFKALMSDWSSALAQKEWTNVSQSMRYSVVELLLYNMRHVQHHAAQLNLLLRQGIDDAPDWVCRADD